jgi:hypothetical protein
MDEFIEDISIYFLMGLTRKYNQAWGTRFYKTLKLLDLDGGWRIVKTRERIEAVAEAGGELEVYKERKEKEIRKLKEKKIEYFIKKHNENMNPTEARLFSDNNIKIVARKGSRKSATRFREHLHRKVNDHILTRR